MLNLCVPVLKRYDMLHGLLRSLETSTVQPDAVYIIDNGMDARRVERAVFPSPVKCVVKTPDRPMGVAESWNWFISNVPAELLISNDDITFAAESIEKMLACDADLVWAAGCGFSCFLLREACIQKVGMFDESISPGYGYYEDEDYLQRLDGRGTRPAIARAMNAECGVIHHHSMTLKASSRAELLEHHRRFKIAQLNYIKKWHLEETFK